MTATTASDRQRLVCALEACADAIADAARQLGAGQVRLRPSRMLATTDADALAKELGGSWVVVRSAAGDAGALRLLLPAGDAATLAGLSLQRSAEQLAALHAAASVDGDELAAWPAVGETVRAAVADAVTVTLGADAILQPCDHAVVTPSADPTAAVGGGPVLAAALECAIDDLTATTVWLVVETALATAWNGGPVDPAQWGGDGDRDGGEHDDEPAAPVRGRMVAYLIDGEALPALRDSSRRVGLELDRRARHEVPNPAALRGAVVVLEVPVADHRRFEWCRRIKAFHNGARVVLLLRTPVRGQVLQGFKAGADAIVGHPFTEQHLTPKLTAMVELAGSAGAGQP